MSRPWMPLWIGDFIADTAHLNAAETGAYLLLIMHYWTTGGLPTDERQLARIARMTPRQWNASFQCLKSLFSEGWKHARIESELATAQEKYEKRASAGKRGGIASGESRKDRSNAEPITITVTSRKKERRRRRCRAGG